MIGGPNSIIIIQETEKECHKNDEEKIYINKHIDKLMKTLKNLWTRID